MHSEALRRNKQKIIDLWEERLRQSSTAFLDQTSPALINSIDIFLDEIIESLLVGQVRRSSQQKTSKAHGKLRTELPGYTLGQVLIEFQILRETVVDVLEDETGTLDRRMLDIILNSIERGLIAAGSEFTFIALGTKEDQLEKSRVELMQSESKLSQAGFLVDKLTEERNLRELFVSTLTHDLRNPLTAAKTSVELLQRKLDDRKTAEVLSNKLLMQVNRISDMISNLLDANRIKVGEKLSFDMNYFDLNSRIRELIEELTEVHGNRLVLRVPQKPITGYWNWEGLRRVIENLVTNAVKYGDPNAPITIGLMEKEKEIQISVHNKGNPISKEDQVTLFEQYRRTRGAQTGGKRGWGLGLTLVRGLTVAHGGRVTLESEEGQGTTFTVTLPRDSRPYL